MGLKKITSWLCLVVAGCAAAAKREGVTLTLGYDTAFGSRSEAAKDTVSKIKKLTAEVLNLRKNEKLVADGEEEEKDVPDKAEEKMEDETETEIATLERAALPTVHPGSSVEAAGAS
jgi:hypothetical protein